MLIRDRATELVKELAPVDQVTFCAAFIQAMDDAARNRLCDTLEITPKASFLGATRRKSFEMK